MSPIFQTERRGHSEIPIDLMESIRREEIRDVPQSSMDRKKLKLTLALAAYAILALIATFTLDGVVRTALWIFFIGLAAKTVAHSHDDDM